MIIAVVNETSAGHRNADVIAALEGIKAQGHTIINAGMKDAGTNLPEGSPQLSYIDTGFLSALLLNSKRADFIVGSCGTGQGFFNAVCQFPNVFCGLVQESLDGWLFAQINGGNCISLALNKGYGWAADVNLQFIFEKLFSVEFGAGYPAYRREAQAISRDQLSQVSIDTHLSFAQIVRKLDAAIVNNVLTFPGVWEILDVDTLEDKDLAEALKARYAEATAK